MRAMIEDDSGGKTTDKPAKARSLRPLAMIWRAAACYPGHVAAALLALVVTAAATLIRPFESIFTRAP